MTWETDHQYIAEMVFK